MHQQSRAAQHKDHGHEDTGHRHRMAGTVSARRDRGRDRQPGQPHKTGEHEFLNWMVLIGAVTPSVLYAAAAHVR